MKTTKTKGAVTLLVMAMVGLAVTLMTGNTLGVYIFSYVIVGQLSMWIVLALAEREDRFTSKRKALVSSVFLLFHAIAKAIIPLAIAIGVGVGIAAWLGLAVASKLISLRIHDLKKPIILDQRADNTNIVNIAEAYHYPSSSSYNPGMLAAATPSGQHSESPQTGLHILVPANMTLEYSTNLIHWGPIHYSGAQDEDTWWSPEGPHGFFRLKADQDPAQELIK